ncbi:DNA polymerase III subunit delta [Glaciecola sp. KUL10]|uniref:DNA polymerase III subunit delta n=1 Tax=Glaciecola sp. (strain KUL10) TaxID=2161813 RepID=UPI000D78242C|nr:DNA polymerase III subunit delta [Glaciecola sp. KUL10]
MQVYPNKFDAHVANKGLPPFVLLFGDEPQQKLQVLDRIRKYAIENGFEERQTLTADSEFSWSQLVDATQTMSLFSDKQYIELTLPTGKPGTEGGKTLTNIANDPSSDTLIVIQGPRIGKDVQNTKWFKQVLNNAIFVHTYTLENNALTQWLKTQCQANGIQLSPNGLNMLSDYSEGNLIAAKQEIEKLTLLVNDGSNTLSMIDDETLANAIIDHSRFTVFQFIDEVLAGNMQRAIKILQRLESEGIEPNIVLWALAKEAQTLQACIEMKQLSGQINFNQLKIWANKQSLYKSALSRLSPYHLKRLTEDLQIADLKLKSESVAKPFVLLSHITLLFDTNNLPELV